MWVYQVHWDGIDFVLFAKVTIKIIFKEISETFVALSNNYYAKIIDSILFFLNLHIV